MTPKEVFNNATIRATVEVFSMETIKKYPMANGLKEDLEQEMWLFLLKRLSTYQPSKSSIETFATRILTIARNRFLRSFFADKNQVVRRSISSCFQTNNSIHFERKEKVCDEIEEMPSPSEGIIQKLDIDTLKENLPSELWVVCERLQEGASVRQMTKEHRISRRQFYGKYILPIRKICCRLGLR